MLEIPESQTVSAQVEKMLLGKKIKKVTAAAAPHKFAFFYGDPAEYPALLEGRTLERARPSAGLVELCLGDCLLTFGDGANLRYYGPGEPLPKKHQLLLQFEEGDSLVCTVRMYGGLMAFRDGENENFYYLVTKEKPSPLSEEFDFPYFEKLFQETNSNLSVKAFLATEQRIPGLGNGCLQDILFTAGLHPKRKLSSLGAEQVETLYQSVKETLLKMTELGGRDTDQDLFGQPGGYQTLLSKNTLPYPCPVCGGPICRQAYLGGNVYFCPNCQPL